VPAVGFGTQEPDEALRRGVQLVLASLFRRRDQGLNVWPSLSQLRSQAPDP
jgi:hypothetical protein